MLESDCCGTAVRYFRNSTHEDVREMVSLSVSKASPVPVDVLTTRWHLIHFHTAERKKPGFYLNLELEA
jgi:hypothetical protein